MTKVMPLQLWWWRKRWRHLRWWVWLRIPRRVTPLVLIRRIRGMGRSPWLDVLRRDPCTYCGGHDRPTIEHVQPHWRVRPTQRTKDARWHEVVGACATCNAARDDQGLLLFLLARHRGLPPKPAKTPAFEGVTSRVRRQQRRAPLTASIGERIRWSGNALDR